MLFVWTTLEQADSFIHWCILQFYIHHAGEYPSQSFHGHQITSDIPEGDE